MSEQSKELAADRFDIEKSRDQNNHVSGRLTRQLDKAEQEVRRAKRIATRVESTEERTTADQNQAGMVE